METKDTSNPMKIKFKSVAEILNDDKFKEILTNEIWRFNREIPSGEIKRHPFQRLSEIDCWNADGLIKVYTEYYLDKTVHYPTKVREFVTDMLSIATRKTIQYYNKQTPIHQ